MLEQKPLTESDRNLRKPLLKAVAQGLQGLFILLGVGGVRPLISNPCLTKLSKLVITPFFF